MTRTYDDVGDVLPTCASGADVAADCATTTGDDIEAASDSANGKRKRKKDEDEKDTFEIHQPPDKPVAALRFRLRYPSFGASSRSRDEAWQELRRAHRDLLQRIQQAVGDVIVYVRDLRQAGKSRFATRQELQQYAQTGELPPDCYPPDVGAQLAAIVESAIKKSGLSEYVYSSVARRLANAEFRGDKLAKLLRGDIAFPSIARAGLMFRNRNWKLEVEKEVVEKDDGKKVTYYHPIITVTSLRPGTGPFKFRADTPYGKSAASKEALLFRLAALGFDTKGTEGLAEGWAKGTLTVQRVERPGCKEEWQLILAYVSPRAQRLKGESVVVVHRGVVNALSMLAASEDDLVIGHHYPGNDIIQAKAQFQARRSRVLRDLTAKADRRNSPKHFRALRKIGNVERRFVDTAIHNMSKSVEKFAEVNNAKLVLIENFGNFLTDFRDDNNHYLQAYLRRFPFYDLKMRCIDKVTRRQGVEVVEGPTRHCSQKCPLCAHVSSDNIAVRPRVPDKPGRFKCVSCGFELGLDEIATLNILLDSPHVSERIKESARQNLLKMKKQFEHAKNAIKQRRDAVKSMQRIAPQPRKTRTRTRT
ncbi:MAG: zinc ribbon domain-containing protein [Candidatus Sigynarchaeota archaeon]